MVSRNPISSLFGKTRHHSTPLRVQKYVSTMHFPRKKGKDKDTNQVGLLRRSLTSQDDEERTEEEGDFVELAQSSTVGVKDKSSSKATTMPLKVQPQYNCYNAKTSLLLPFKVCTCT